MANTTLNMQLLLRRAQFLDTCVLAEGEPGYHTGTHELKIGDGITPWSELGFANKAQIEALIKVVDDKVAALGNTYATDAEVEGIRAALQDAIDTKLAAETFNTYSASRKLTDTEINTAIGNVDAKFASYRTAAEQDAIDETLATKEALKAVTDELAGYGDIVTHNVAEFATAAQGAKADAAAVKTEVEGALALKADKSVVDAMYTNSQIDGFIADAKKYADDNDANTEYHVEYDSTNKKIKLVAGADASKMEIDATDFIKDGMIDTVTIGDDNDLVITFNTAAGKDAIRLPLDQLVDIYTGVEGTRINVSVSSDKKVSADLVAGSISKNYLDTAVQTSLGLAESALQSADLADYAKTADVVTNDEFTAFEGTNAEAIGKKLDKSTYDAYIAGKAMSDAELKKYAEDEADAAESAAKSHADSLNTAMDGRVTKLENNDAGYATTSQVATAKQEAIDAAKAYADGKEHKNTTYTVAATENALEFTVTPSEGDAQTVKLVAPVVNTGVMEVAAGEDIVVTPGENGKVTVAHAAFTTGEYTKDPASSDKTGDVYMMTSVTVDNGHVTGANVKSLAAALEGMTFIFDGGTSAN